MTRARETLVRGFADPDSDKMGLHPNLDADHRHPDSSDRARENIVADWGGNSEASPSRPRGEDAEASDADSKRHCLRSDGFLRPTVEHVCDLLRDRKFEDCSWSRSSRLVVVSVLDNIVRVCRQFGGFLCVLVVIVFVYAVGRLLGVC